VDEPKASRPFWPDALQEPSDPTRGLMPWTWALERLQKSHNYWIATSRPDFRPHLMIVWGIWLDDAFWFSTGLRTRKARNLSDHSSCVIGTEDTDEAVILEGTAKRMEAAEEKKHFAAVYDRKYGGNIEPLIEPGVGLVIRVEPSVVFGFDENAENFGEAATRWKFAKT
jgi:hypothetical protein